MLNTQTMDKLQALRLEGMAQALEEQRRQPDISQLEFRRAAWPCWSNGSGCGKKTGRWPRACITRN